MLAMQREPEAETTQPTSVGDTRGFEEWLDQLAGGECGWESVFRGVLDSITANPDSGWELLALVDQYYRRHRISPEDFHGLNAQVQALLIGGIRTAEVKPPPKAAPSERRASLHVQPAAEPIARPAPQPVARPVAKPAAPSAKPAVQNKVTDIGQPPRTRALVVNEVLRGRYRIRGILGHGGMGTVYAAIDEFRLDHDGGQQVAIKALHTEVVQRPQLLAELRSEFQRLQSLSHPNIVRVHEFDRDGDLTFFTMEQLSGAPLSRVLAYHNQAALYRPYALSIIHQTGGAVAYAHSRGIVHGDINPGNVFITDEGEIRVLDFGASYRLHRDPIPDLDDFSRPAVATPSYASCDVLQGAPANVRDDIYAMACVSYVLLTGKHPFLGQNALQARSARLSPRRPAGLTHRQWSALKAGLQFDRQRRPADLQAWLDELHVQSEAAQLPPLATIMNLRPPPGGHAGWLTVGAIAVVAALCWWALDNADQVARAAAGASGTAENIWNKIRGDVGTLPLGKPPAAAVSGNGAAMIPSAATRIAQRAAATAAPVVLERQVPTASAASSAIEQPTAAPVPAHPSQARIEMESDELAVEPMQSVASVIVRRKDSFRNDVSFTWWTEAGTAKPGQDFVPVQSRVEFIPGGDHQTTLMVPVVSDPRRHESKSFYVVIDEPGDGARLGSRTLTMVTIPPSY